MRAITVLAAAALAAAPAAANAAPRLQPVASGLHARSTSPRPTAMPACSSSSRPGRIRVLRAGKLTTFLDIRQNVDSGGETGLLSVAFHPDFATNHRLYVDYTAQGANGLETRVVEYRARGNRALPGSARVLLRIHQPYENHNGGSSPSARTASCTSAWATAARAATRRTAPRTRELLGKILRIDVDTARAAGSTPSRATNPYRRGGGKPEIWALGVRNPWRFSFDRADRRPVDRRRRPGRHRGDRLREARHRRPAELRLGRLRGPQPVRPEANARAPDPARSASTRTPRAARSQAASSSAAPAPRACAAATSTPTTARAGSAPSRRRQAGPAAPRRTRASAPSRASARAATATSTSRRAGPAGSTAWSADVRSRRRRARRRARPRRRARRGWRRTSAAGRSASRGLVRLVDDGALGGVVLGVVERRPSRCSRASRSSRSTRSPPASSGGAPGGGGRAPRGRPAARERARVDGLVDPQPARRQPEAPQRSALRVRVVGRPEQAPQPPRPPQDGQERQTAHREEDHRADRASRSPRRPRRRAGGARSRGSSSRARGTAPATPGARSRRTRGASSRPRSRRRRTRSRAPRWSRP